LLQHTRCEYNRHSPSRVYALTTHLFSRRRGSIRAVYIFVDQAMGLFPFSRAPRMCFSMDQTTDDFPRAWDVRRSDQKQSRTAGRKRMVAKTSDHLASTSETISVPEKQTESSWCYSQAWFGPRNRSSLSFSQRRISRGPRGLFRVFWKHTSEACLSKPRLSHETITLIRQMAANNRRLRDGAHSGRAPQAGYSGE
jgi:hypothetical protein